MKSVSPYTKPKLRTMVASLMLKTATALSFVHAFEEIRELHHPQHGLAVSTAPSQDNQKVKRLPAVGARLLSEL